MKRRLRIFYPYGIEQEQAMRKRKEEFSHISPLNDAPQCRCIAALSGPKDLLQEEALDETALHRAFGGDVG